MVQNAQAGKVIYPANVPGLKNAWAYTTEDTIESSPLIDGKVLYIGSQDSTLDALNALTGEKVWSYTAVGSILSTPIAVNDLVYLGSNDQSLYVFNQLHILKGNHHV